MIDFTDDPALSTVSMQRSLRILPNILDGKPLIAQGSEGINGVMVANAILLSSWLGKEVELPVDEQLYIDELNKRIAEEGKYPLISG